MKASFNVLDQPWIPVVTQSGAEENLGIRSVLSRAHTLQGISSASPLEEYALYRFLGLFIMDAMRPESEEDIEDLLDAGQFDPGTIEKYISVCLREGVSFDLFDEDRPFLQSKYDPAIDGPPKAAGILDFMRASGNNHVHFDHTPSAGVKFPQDKAARLLLVSYLFCTAAAQGYPSGVNASPPYFGIIRGDTLYETLIHTLLPLDRIGIPFDNPPVLWRRANPVIPKQEVGKTSWLQGMLFPTRRIHLIPDESGTVSTVHFCQGENFVNKNSWHDPYVTYRLGKDGFFPMRPSADRAVWRNISDILNIAGGHASQLLSIYQSVKESNTVNLTLYGVETSNASYLGVYRHSLTLPLCLAEDESAVDILHRCIATSETLANTLRKSLSNVEAIPKGAISLTVQQYYQDCETRFWTLCNLAAEKRICKEDYTVFCDDVSAIASASFSKSTASLNLRATTLAEAEKQRGYLYKTINKLKKEARL